MGKAQAEHQWLFLRVHFFCRLSPSSSQFSLLPTSQSLSPSQSYSPKLDFLKEFFFFHENRILSQIFIAACLKVIKFAFIISVLTIATHGSIWLELRTSLALCFWTSAMVCIYMIKQNRHYFPVGAFLLMTVKWQHYENDPANVGSFLITSECQPVLST